MIIAQRTRSSGTRVCAAECTACGECPSGRRARRSGIVRAVSPSGCTGREPFLATAGWVRCAAPTFRGLHGSTTGRVAVGLIGLCPADTLPPARMPPAPYSQCQCRPDALTRRPDVLAQPALERTACGECPSGCRARRSGIVWAVSTGGARLSRTPHSSQGQAKLTTGGHGAD